MKIVSFILWKKVNGLLANTIQSSLLEDNAFIKMRPTSLPSKKQSTPAESVLISLLTTKPIIRIKLLPNPSGKSLASKWSLEIQMMDWLASSWGS